MITLNAAEEPERGFVADYSTLVPTSTGSGTPGYLGPDTAGRLPMPWLSEWREPTISLTRTVLTNSAGGTSTTPIFRFPPKET